MVLCIYNTSESESDILSLISHTEDLMLAKRRQRPRSILTTIGVTQRQEHASVGFRIGDWRSARGVDVLS